MCIGGFNACLFVVIGPVKELRETPNKRNQRFVEFYDVRNAATAMAAMSGQEIYGRKVMIEYSRRGGGQSKKPWKAAAAAAVTSPSPYPSANSSSSSYRSCFQKGNPSGSGSDHGSKSSGCSTGSSSECNQKKMTVMITSCKKSNNTPSKLTPHTHSRPWKGGGIRKEHDPRFLINQDAIIESNCKDPRTTVMIKNIPNKYR